MLDAINTYLCVFILCFHKLHICVFIWELGIEKSVLGYLIKWWLFCLFFLRLRVFYLSTVWSLGHVACIICVLSSFVQLCIPFLFFTVPLVAFFSRAYRFFPSTYTHDTAKTYRLTSRLSCKLPVKIVIPDCKNRYISRQTWNITFVDR